MIEILLLLLVLGLLWVLFGSSGFIRKYGKGSRYHTPVGSVEGPGEFGFDIVGESHYQRALAHIAGAKEEDGKRHRCMATLVLEDDNPHDDKAVRVDINGETVGYLDRRMARQYRKEIARQGIAAACLKAQALIVGGWKRGSDDEGSYGVKLDLPLKD